MYSTLKTAVANRFRAILIVGAFGACWYLLLRCQPVDAMSPGVLAWWTALCGVSFFNVWAWQRSYAAFASRKADADPAVDRFQLSQLALSGIYVLGCAFRSFLPRADVQRFGLIDSWMSSVLVGRSVATVAELCFAAQWALLLHVTAKEANARLGMAVSWLLVPLIVFAEICSWYGVLTTAYIGNAIEESTWALAAFLLIVSFAALWPSCKAVHRPFVTGALVLGAAYLTFMCAVDIPMYLSRWRADEADGRAYLSLSQGVWDAGSRWIVTHSWEHWHTEIPWMSLYFSVGVWCSLALAQAPRLQVERAKTGALHLASAAAQ